MNYIYDIYLNLNDVLYDFFEWNKNDKVTHIKKIPIFKINKDSFKSIVFNKIKIYNNILIEILNKTELWNSEDKVPYCALFTNSDDIIAIQFNNKGNSIKKSYLFIDEELEVLETIKRVKEKNISFKIQNKEKLVFKTRKQINEEKFILNELKNMGEDKLNYIYFECFGKKCENKNTILKSIKNISKDSKIYENLYNILKLTSTTKK